MASKSSRGMSAKRVQVPFWPEGEKREGKENLPLTRRTSISGNRCTRNLTGGNRSTNCQSIAKEPPLYPHRYIDFANLSQFFSFSCG